MCTHVGVLAVDLVGDVVVVDVRGVRSHCVHDPLGHVLFIVRVDVPAVGSRVQSSGNSYGKSLSVYEYCVPAVGSRVQSLGNSYGKSPSIYE